MLWRGRRRRFGVLLHLGNRRRLRTGPGIPRCGGAGSLQTGCVSKRPGPLMGSRWAGTADHHEPFVRRDLLDRGLVIETDGQHLEWHSLVLVLRVRRFRQRERGCSNSGSPLPLQRLIAGDSDGNGLTIGCVSVKGERPMVARGVATVCDGAGGCAIGAGAAPSYLITTTSPTVTKRTSAATSIRNWRRPVRWRLRRSLAGCLSSCL